MLTSTTFEIASQRIVRHLGVVRGITVWSCNVFGTIGASLQTLFGGNISLYTQFAEKARNEAFELMIEYAAEAGANAIVRVRYDATDVAAGVTEVLVYGTAVVVERS